MWQYGRWQYDMWQYIVFEGEFGAWGSAVPIHIGDPSTKAFRTTAAVHNCMDRQQSIRISVSTRHFWPV